MANGVTYGINFPFNDSLKGDYLSLSQNPDQEIRSNLIHLILTRKGSRYYLPDFGTKIYEFIFEPLDGVTFESIKDDIRDNVSKYIPNLIINILIIFVIISSGAFTFFISIKINSLVNEWNEEF